MKIRIYLNYKDLEKIKELKEILGDINRRDSTFKFQIGDRYILIDAETKDIAHRRALWMVHKIPALLNHPYKVVD